MSSIRFLLNGRPVEAAGISPNTTLLGFLRQHLGQTDAKEGCAEGDCGACTVAILDPDAPGGPAFRAENSCLILLPMVHGKSVVTAAGLKTGKDLHTVQAAMVRTLGSQCGYCTPGFVMSLFEACYRRDLDQPWKLDDQIAGNLCRCTGYRPIRDALTEVAGLRPDDRFSAALAAPPALDGASLDYAHGGERFALPTSLAELLGILAARPAARLVAGGTDLALEITKRFESLPDLVSLERVPELKVLAFGDPVIIGGGVRLSDLEAELGPKIPALGRMLCYFGARQIKHRATVGGNLSTASPIGDLAPILLALDAEVVLAGPTGRRRVPLSEFFLAYRTTARAPGEVLERVELPAPAATDRVAAYKVSKRQELDISAVSAGFFVRVEDGVVTAARLAYGGLAATPARARGAEAALVGGPWTEAAARAAAERLDADFQPIDDHRGSAWYRRTVAKNLLVGFFAETSTHPSPSLGHRPVGTIQPGGRP